MYKIMFSANRDNFSTSILIWMTFISYYCSIAQARTSRAMLNRTGESRCPCFFLILEKKLSTFLQWCDNSCGLAIYCLYHVPFIPTFVEGFYHKKMLNFVKFSFCIYCDDYVVFIFHSINVFVTFIDLHMFNHSWTRDESHWIMVYATLNVLLNLFNILLRMFPTIFIRNIDL